MPTPGPLARWLLARGVAPEARYCESGDYRTFEWPLVTMIHLTKLAFRDAGGNPDGTGLPPYDEWPDGLKSQVHLLARQAFITTVVRGDWLILNTPGVTPCDLPT